MADTDTAPTAATRWIHIGNANTVELDSGVQMRSSMVSISGLRRQGRSHETGSEPKIKLTVNEFTDEVARIALGDDPTFDYGSAGSDNAQTGLSAAAGTAWNFNTGSSGVAVVAGQRTQIYDASGARVMDVTAVVLSGAVAQYGAAGDSMTLAEDVDYKLDPQTGEILWLKAISNDTVTPTITSNTITATSKNYASKIKAFLKGFKERYFMLRCYDQDDDFNMALWSEDIHGRISREGSSTADGQNDFENNLVIDVFNDPVCFKRDGTN